jgi:uncharacterized membrane protein
MHDWLSSFARHFPEPLAVLLLAALPISELRFSIPFAVQAFGMPVVQAFAWSVVGNIIPVPFILLFLGPVTAWAEDHWAWLHRLLDRLFAHSRRRHTARFDRMRDAALVTFVAIPLPITGAWSGALAAFVFGVEPRKATVLISMGVVIAGVIVSVLTIAGVALLG